MHIPAAIQNQLFARSFALLFARIESNWPMLAFMALSNMALCANVNPANNINAANEIDFFILFIFVVSKTYDSFYKKGINGVEL